MKYSTTFYINMPQNLKLLHNKKQISQKILTADQHTKTMQSNQFHQLSSLDHLKQ